MITTPKEGLNRKIYSSKRINEVEIKKRFKNNKSIQEGFLKMFNKGNLIKTNIWEYIDINYSKEVAYNIRRIWNNKKVTKDIEKKIDTWNKENRSSERYLLDIVSAWLTEDCVLYLLSSIPYIQKNYTLYLAGTDSKREIKNATECTRNPDIKMVHHRTGKNVYMEVMEDNSGYVRRTEKFDLRWGENGNSCKYDDLMKLCEEGDNAIIIIIDIKNAGLIFVPIKKAKVVKYKYKNPAYNYRYCTQLRIKYRKCFRSFDNLKFKK